MLAPRDIEPLPAAPSPGDPHAAALGYWSALLHVLVYSLGWARPDRGLERWFGAGKPTENDRRLHLLEVYDIDGTLDLFAAWAWTSPQIAPIGKLIELTGYRDGSGRSSRTAVLVLDSMRGWYRALAELGSTLPDIGSRSWHVDAVIRPFGCLGTYRRSRQTGLWFAGPHHLHAPDT